jgi:hypothetical protein
VVRGTPIAAGDVAVHFADVYGTGTTSIVWSRDAAARPGGYGAQYQALDLSGGTKPYLLVGVDNGMGASTRITYGSSARHCAEDARAGAPWATPLPVPVQVVELVELVEQVTGARHVTRYRYHHGYYDGRPVRPRAPERSGGSGPRCVRRRRDAHLVPHRDLVRPRRPAAWRRLVR